MHGGYTVGWGTLALINAALAQNRGRSGLNWFLLSLLLGPIATLLLVVWGVETEPQPSPWTTRDQLFNAALGVGVVVAAFVVLALIASQT